MVKQLTSRVNGLSLLASRASFETKLMVANGIFISKLCYLIQLWGGCEDYLFHPLQVLQNRAARLVTGCGWFTPKRVLLQRCNWLSIKQLAFYQSVVMAHKIATNTSPLYLAQRMTTDHPRRTRQATSGCIRYGDNLAAAKSLTQKGFCIRGTIQYNSVPASIREAKTIDTFKVKLKKWVATNIPID